MVTRGNVGGRKGNKAKEKKLAIVVKRLLETETNLTVKLFIQALETVERKTYQNILGH